MAERMEEEVLDKCKVKESKKGTFKGNPLEWRRVRRSKKYRIRKWRQGCCARIFSCFRKYNLQRLQSKQEESTTEEVMKQQQRMAIMKVLMKKIRSKGSMDAKNRRWVADLLAKVREKAWTHTGWEGTMQKWYEWLKYLKKKDEKEEMEEMHQRKVEKMIILHKITKPTVWRGGVQILKEEEEEDAKLSDRCEAKRQELTKHWQCDEEIQNMRNEPWRNEEMKECEEALPRLKEVDLDKTSRLYKAKKQECDVADSSQKFFRT